LHEGPQKQKRLLWLKQQMENASNREADLLWNSIQALEKATNSHSRPLEKKAQRRIFRR